METLQQQTTSGNTLAPHANLFERAANAVIHFVRQLPEAAPEAMSEHSGHAEKRNDLTPAVDLSHNR